MNRSFLAVCLVFGLVAAASADCFDFNKDGAETDVDCGGAECWARCSSGESCLVDSDCASGNCASNLCAAAAESRFLAGHLSGESGESGHDHDHDHDDEDEASVASTQSVTMAGLALIASLALKVIL